MDELIDILETMGENRLTFQYFFFFWFYREGLVGGKGFSFSFSFFLSFFRGAKNEGFR